MRISRVYVDHALPSGSEVSLDSRASRYLTQVLRLRAGDRLILFNGDGNDIEAELLSCDKRGCSAHLLRITSSESPPSLAIHLAIGISRGERMDYALQKSVELGVQSITPLITERTVVQLKGDRITQRTAHWQGIVASACEQSGRSILPDLSMPTELTTWLARSQGGFMLHHAAENGFAAFPAPTTQTTLLIGPEGGLTEHERALATASGFEAVRMGPRVMRTETAPVAAIAAIQTLWGDFR